ncbi:MAG: CotH kinase family protein, partial [Planctomycetota bacterium]
TSVVANPLVINEIQASNGTTLFDDENDSPDWVEIKNVSDTEISLLEWGLSDDNQVARKWIFPDVVIQPGEHLLVWCSGKNRTSPSSESITARDSQVPFEPSYIDGNSEFSYLVGSPDQGPFPEGWATLDFDDAKWSRARGSIGFGEDFFANDIEKEALGSTAFLTRHRFDIDNLARVASLILNVQYDDGAVVFLNGQRVYDINYRDEEDPHWASRSRSSREADDPERFDLSPHRNLLVEGTNVLAIATLNLRNTSADMGIGVELGTVPPVLHTNFQLARAGGPVVLSDPNDQLVDALVYPEQAPDRSYGRYEDGSGPFLYMLIPTPGDENDSRTSDDLIPDTIQFSPPPGNVGRAIDISLSANVPFEGFHIRYTINGDPPSPSSTVFEGPINIRRDTVIRAAGFVGEEAVTKDVSASYWGVTASTRGFQLPVISISMRNLDYQTVHNQSQSRGPSSERPGYIEFYDKDGVRLHGTGFGLRLHGGAGRGGDFNIKKAYKAYFRGRYGDKKLRLPVISDTEVEVFDKLMLRSNFNDAFRTGAQASLIRDQVIRDIHGDMGQPFSHGTWYNLFVNMRYRGVYNVVERMDKDFFDSYFEDGDNWDVVKTGDDILDGTGAQWGLMRNFFSRNRTLNDDLYAQAQDLIDVENFTSYMILNIWAQNHDWPHNNWYAARPQRPDGKWIFLSWDAEFGIGRIPGGYTSDTFAHASGSNATFGVMLSSLLTHHEYQNFFLQKVDEYFEGPLSNENVRRHIDRHVNAIQGDIPEELRVAGHGNSIQTWNNNINAVRTFALRRNTSIGNFIRNSSRFRFPRVTSVRPSTIEMEGPTEVQVRGVNFTRNTVITFNGVEATDMTYESTRLLVVSVPYDVSLAGRPTINATDPLNGEGSPVSLLRVSFVDPAPASLQPPKAAVGEMVTIIGEDFLEEIRVEFGGVPSPNVERVAREVLQVEVPPGKGTVDVMVYNTEPGDVPAEAALSFEYDADGSPRFSRGDTDGNGSINVTDPIRILWYLTVGLDSGPICEDSMDVDDSGSVNVTDGIVALNYLFREGPAPQAPFGVCARDPTEDQLTCEAVCTN